MSAPSPKRKQLIWLRDNWTCKYCGKKVAYTKQNKHNMATVDHIKPRAIGGKNNLENLVTACIQCNSRKGIGEFRPYIKDGVLYGLKSKNEEAL